MPWCTLPGADSLANDRLGCFNLTLDGHAEAVKFMKRFGLPLLVTGGAHHRPYTISGCKRFHDHVRVASLDINLS